MLIEIYYSNVTWGEDLISAISKEIFTSFSERSGIITKSMTFVTSMRPLITPLAARQKGADLHLQIVAHFAEGTTGIADPVQ
jgi:hypothetical protein